MFFGVPTMYARLADHPRLPELARAAAVRLRLGAARADAVAAHRRRQRSAGARALRHERDRDAHVEPVRRRAPAGHRRRCPLPGVEVRLGDGDGVEVRGPNVFAGYWERPEATADAFTDDGWFRTGDVGAFDDDGYLSPRRPQQRADHHRRLQRLPARGRGRRCARTPRVADVAVVGVPDETWGERVVAFVVAAPTARSRRRRGARRALRRAQLADYKRPRRVGASSTSCRATRWARSGVTCCATQSRDDGGEREPVRIAACQVEIDYALPFDERVAARRRRRARAAGGSDLVVLPELWPSGGVPLRRGSPTRRSRSTVRSSRRCAAAARDAGVWLHGGSFVERAEDGRLFNTSRPVRRRAASCARPTASCTCSASAAARPTVLVGGRRRRHVRDAVRRRRPRRPATTCASPSCTARSSTRAPCSPRPGRVARATDRALAAARPRACRREPGRRRRRRTPSGCRARRASAACRWSSTRGATCSPRPDPTRRGAARRRRPRRRRARCASGSPSFRRGAPARSAGSWRWV